MAHSDSHWGDEDPEYHDDHDSEHEDELFDAANHLGWTPDEMQDKEFAAKYKEWLARQPK